MDGQSSRSVLVRARRERERESGSHAMAGWLRRVERERERLGFQIRDCWMAGWRWEDGEEHEIRNFIS